MKRPGNENLFATGFLFRERGYDTKFVYGGYGLFDNMNFFFAHNGFDAVDRRQFADDERTFGNVWGVCDENLFRRTAREAGRSHAAGRPFFLHVMTTTNHQPYTYPDGRIDVPSGTGRSGAAKYTDFAIGKFLDPERERILRIGRVRRAHQPRANARREGLALKTGRTDVEVRASEHTAERIGCEAGFVPEMARLLSGVLEADRRHEPTERVMHGRNALRCRDERCSEVCRLVDEQVGHPRVDGRPQPG